MDNKEMAEKPKQATLPGLESKGSKKKKRKSAAETLRRSRAMKKSWLRRKRLEAKMAKMSSASSKSKAARYSRTLRVKSVSIWESLNGKALSIQVDGPYVFGKCNGLTILLGTTKQLTVQ